MNIDDIVVFAYNQHEIALVDVVIHMIFNVLDGRLSCRMSEFFFSIIYFMLNT